MLEFPVLENGKFVVPQSMLVQPLNNTEINGENG